MSVQILTDSTSDILPEEAEQKGVRVVPLLVNFGEEAFRENVEITHQEYFRRLAQAESLPTTSQPTPQDFLAHFEQVRDAGDSLVCVLLASKLSGTFQSAQLAKELSGTYQSACIAKKQFPEAVIQVVDTRQVTFGLALLVRQAAALRDAGHTGPEIAEQISRLAARVRLYAVIDDLKYLRLGGRLSSAGAVLGTLLGIKPIISVQDGQVVCVHKMRGQKAGCAYVLERAGQEGIDPALPVCFGHSHLPGAAEELRDMAGSLLDGCG